MPGSIAAQPELDDQQFAVLVADSEADEVIAMLQYRGQVTGQHSRCYSSVSRALKIARKSPLDLTSKVSWCERCLLYGLEEDDAQAAMQLAQWVSLAQTTE
jgi:hypothetical protein